MRYLKEIIKAIRDKKKLPGLIELWKQHARWSYYQKNKDVFQNAIPWMSFSAVDFLNDELRKDMRVFEYGGGGSTLFFASRVGELVTVEHDRNWFEGLKKVIEKNTRIKWKGSLIEPDAVASTVDLKINNPDDYYSNDKNFNDKIFKKYASAIDQYPDEWFDLVLIDGRARPSCLKHSLNKVKKNGFLVLDNSDIPHYLEQLGGRLNNYQLISDYFGPTPYSHWFTQANIWKRKE